MRFIIDNQLPPSLAARLRDLGHDAVHVVDLGLDEACDRAIWQVASSQGGVVVSKDEDFLSLSIANPDGPAFVWVRMGNCRASALHAAFDARIGDIVRELTAGQRVVEIR